MMNVAPAGKADSTKDEQRILPYEEPMRTWAGHGTGVLCNICGLPIRTQDIEYEVELVTSVTVRNLHFHFNCYRVWESQGC